MPSTSQATCSSEEQARLQAMSGPPTIPQAKPDPLQSTPESLAAPQAKQEALTNSEAKPEPPASLQAANEMLTSAQAGRELISELLEINGSTITSCTTLVL